MEKVATAAAFSTSSFGFSSWEEVFVSSDRGSREVHYYLKRRDESSDLAVVGKEKSLRHMSYHYALRNRLPFSSSLVKLKSRREVIDWLNSIVSGAYADKLSRLDVASLDGKDAKDIQSQKFSQYTKDFLWLGLPWSCRKKRKHYPSFQRNGVKISVHDFVYVLAEEGKRLVAYLEDLYEDSRGNKMVVVRWFHKIDEVGIILPLNFNDREIFCSLCLQDLSIECIDGLATVLGPLHFEKFMSEARHTRLEPFVCRKQFDNDEVRPFDITRLKGYWKQDILRYMHTLSPSVDQGSSEQSDEEYIEEGDEDAVNGIRLRKRQCTERRDSVRAARVVVRNSSGNDTCIVRGGSSAATLSNKLAKDNSQNFEVGCDVEVLSQDSGMRGCWFRASIIKRRRDKVKVRYQDVQDADDESNMLEEWILASRAASSDQLGLRIRGRTVVRPAPQSSKGRVSWLVDIGTVVDVWRHDGWWEGIVFQKESEDRFRVYFPAEKQDSVFSCRELRHSQEWLGNGWTQMKERPDLAAKILHNFVSKDSEKTSHHISAAVVISESKLPSKDESGRKDSSPDTSDKNVKPKPGKRSLDLSKDDLLSQLKWKSSKKRRRGSGNSVHKVQYTQTLSNGAPNSESSRACERFVIPANLKVDHDNCKFMGDSLFSSSVVPPLTSLVMSR